MKVAICLFSYRTANTSSLMGVMNGLMPYTRAHGVECTITVYGHALIDTARNDALTAALMDPDVTHVLFSDDDMLPQQDAIIRMVHSGMPVVSALCTTRNYANLRIAGSVYDEAQDRFGELADLRRDRLVTGSLAPGTGFLLIDRPTIAQLIEYHLSARDWLDENDKRLSRLHVRSAPRENERARLEVLRRQRYQSWNKVRIFEFAVNDRDEKLGEDISLGRKLLKLGIPVSIDPMTVVGHIGEYPYTIYDVDAREQNDNRPD